MLLHQMANPADHKQPKKDYRQLVGTLFGK